MAKPSASKTAALPGRKIRATKREGTKNGEATVDVLGGQKSEPEGRGAEGLCLEDFFAAEDLRAFSALSSAWRIRLASSLASASSRWTYSSMVFQPNSDLSAKIINFYCLESIDVPSARDALAFSTALDSRWDFTSSRLSWSLAMNFYWIVFPFCVKDFGSLCWIFLISRSCLSATPKLDC